MGPDMEWKPRFYSADYRSWASQTGGAPNKTDALSRPLRRETLSLLLGLGDGDSP